MKESFRKHKKVPEAFFYTYSFLTVYNAKLSVFSYRFSRFPMAVTISSDVSRKNGVRNQKLFQKGDGRNLYA